MSTFNKPTVETVTEQEFYEKLRNNVIEEVAKEIEKMMGFGKDTISSLTIYVRNMKK